MSLESDDPIKPVERYVTRRELADIMGVSISTIDSLVPEAHPHRRNDP